MLDKLDVTNQRGDVLSLYMQESDSEYQVSSIEGLDPVPASLVSTNYAGSDGEHYQGGKRGARDIKIKLDLDPNFAPNTYSDLRMALYTYFMPKSRITLRFYLSTGLYVDIIGIVETMSAPLFEKDPNVEVSVRCFQPDFVDGRMITIEGNTVDDGTNTIINYPGTIESGIVVTLHVNRVLTDFTIYNTDQAGNLLQLDFTGELEDGDELVISSLKGNKGITLTRASVSSSYLYGRSAQSSWIELFTGLNQFRVFANDDPVPYTLEYLVRYGGI